MSQSDLTVMKNRIKILEDISKTLLNLSKEPVPKNLPSNQQKEVEKYNNWLKEKSARLKQMADKWQSELKKPPPKGKEAEVNTAMIRTFNEEYLQLQQNMQQENRQFTLISNIMKTKHDTAKNAINNVR